MIKKIVLLLMVSIASFNVVPAEEELSTELMQAIEDTNKSLSSNIAVNDVNASIKDTKDLIEMFSKVEGFYVNKGDSDNALELIRKIKGYATNIQTSITAKDFASATNSATDLSRTCRTCHTFYKKD